MNRQTNNRVWRFDKIGGPAVLHLDPLPIPEPDDEDVVVKVDAFGLNRSDLLWLQAAFYQPTLPARIGYEIAA